MSEMSEGRVSLSREVLRAELAEMELRLRIWIASELEEKASATEVEKLRGEFHERVAWADGLIPLRDRLIAEHEVMWKERENAIGGQFTLGQQTKMREIIQQVYDAQEQSGFTKRERYFAIITVLFLTAVPIINFLDLHGVI